MRLGCYRLHLPPNQRLQAVEQDPVQRAYVVAQAPLLPHQEQQSVLQVGEQHYLRPSAKRKMIVAKTGQLND